MSDRKRNKGTRLKAVLRTTVREADQFGRSLVGLHNRMLVGGGGRGVGTAPGVETHELPGEVAKWHEPQKAIVTCIDFSPEKAEMQRVTDVGAFLAQHRPEWSKVRWINIDGLGDGAVIKAFAEKYQLHPLAIEDVLHVPQRPKVEIFPAHGEQHPRVFIIARMLRMMGEGEECHLQGEQISFFLGLHTLLSFQERPDGDVFDPIRERINAAGSRLRENDASFLLYALLDAIVDHCFPILEHYSDVLEELEDQVLARPDKRVIQEIHGTKRELLLLRRAVWPMREVIGQLAREHQECLSEVTQTYLRDVHDHSVQIMDMVETYREFASGLTETYMTALSNRMNEVMKVLTIMTTIFVPLTFLAGVYGMNFEHLPELHWKYSYYIFWGVCIVTAVGMLAWFRWRKWI